MGLRDSGVLFGRELARVEGPLQEGRDLEFHGTDSYAHPFFWYEIIFARYKDI